MSKNISMWTYFLFCFSSLKCLSTINMYVYSVKTAQRNSDATITTYINKNGYRSLMLHRDMPMFSAVLRHGH